MEQNSGQDAKDSQNYVIAKGRGHNNDFTSSLREEPHVEPNKCGIVEPPFKPPRDRPGPWTNQLAYLRKVVISLCARHIAIPFLNPVDTIYLNIPDYHEIITTPMDLTTIKKRLQNNYYSTARECLRDFERIFSNCKSYNPPTDAVYKMGLDLKKIYRAKLVEMPEPEIATEKRFKRKFPQPIASKLATCFKRVVANNVVQNDNHAVLPKSRRTSSSSCFSTSSSTATVAVGQKTRIYDDHQHGVSSYRKNVKDIPNATSSSWSSVSSPQRKFGKSLSPFDFKEKENDHNQNADTSALKPMSLEMRRELQLDLSRLNEAQLCRVCNIILSKEPSVIAKDLDDDEIDLEKLTLSTLWELENYVAGCLKKEPVFEPPKTKINQSQQKQQPPHDTLTASAGSSIIIQSDKRDFTKSVPPPSKKPEKKTSHRHQLDNTISPQERDKLCLAMSSLPGDKVGGVLGILLRHWYDTGAVKSSILCELKAYLNFLKEEEKLRQQVRKDHQFARIGSTR